MMKYYIIVNALDIPVHLMLVGSRVHDVRTFSPCAQSIDTISQASNWLRCFWLLHI